MGKGGRNKWMDELVEEKLDYLRKTIDGIAKATEELEVKRGITQRPTYVMLENLNAATTYLEHILTSLRMQVEEVDRYAGIEATKEEEKKKEDTMFR